MTRHDEKHRGAAMIQLKRVYDKRGPRDGARFLVERLWPRGVRKASLKMDAWLRSVAPSADLRRWFNHDTARWTEFRRRYYAELDAHPEAWSELVGKAQRGRVTLLYSACDQQHNNAVALRDYVRARLRTQRRGAKAQRA